MTLGFCACAACIMSVTILSGWVGGWGVFVVTHSATYTPFDGANRTWVLEQKLQEAFLSRR